MRKGYVYALSYFLTYSLGNRIVAICIQPMHTSASDSLSEFPNLCQDSFNVDESCQLLFEGFNDNLVFSTQSAHHDIRQASYVRCQRVTTVVLNYVSFSINANRSRRACANQDTDAFTTLREYLTQVGHVKVGIVYCSILHLSIWELSSLRSFWNLSLVGPAGFEPATYRL